eukprot:TRINITY_DN8304_c0_g1_i2.p1 TRINITY_DN8304_c0_g1~~TRINITY_DN8304_c0_g1_i2.p1  ORF type:complete len:468 (+),score=127.25 TRINITY_DN8304_c0_g1_i2:14-1417(+)
MEPPANLSSDFPTEETVQQDKQDSENFHDESVSHPNYTDLPPIQERDLRKSQSLSYPSSQQEHEIMPPEIEAGMISQELQPLHDKEAELLPQLESILQALNLSNVHIKEVMTLVLDRVHHQHKEEFRQSVERQSELFKTPDASRFISGWISRWRYKRILQQRKLANQLLGEILNTERTFVKRLQRLKEISSGIATKESKKNKRGSIAPDLLNDMFSNLDMILGLHQQILHSMDLATASADKGSLYEEREYVKIFGKMIPLLPLYRPYVYNFDKAMSIVKEMAEDKKFIKSLEKKETTPAELMDLMACPLYRIPEYTEFIGRLSAVGMTDSQSAGPFEGDAGLQSLHSQLKAISKSVQQSIDDEENLQKVKELHSLLGEKLETNPSRRYIREGVLGYRLDSKEKWRHRTAHDGYVYLLTDQIVVVQRNKTAKLVQQVPLVDCQVVDIPDSIREKNVFSLVELGRALRV